MFKLKKKNIIQHYGFTLLETMIAMFILGTAVSGLVFVTASGVNNTAYVKDRLTAKYLAQEGTEVVRNIRDTQMRFVSAGQDRDTAWQNFISTINSCKNNFCIIDATEFPLSSGIIGVCKGVCPKIKFDDNNNIYTHKSGANSKYTRSIRIIDVGFNQVIVLSTVE